MSEALRHEAVVFGRYLVERELGDALIERYVRGNALLAGLGTPAEHAVVAYARAHPWAIPLLDAAAGIRGERSLLRRKLLLLAAIVETAPELVDATAPVDAGLPRLALRVGTAGVRAAVHAACGLALDAVVRRRA